MPLLRTVVSAAATVIALAGCATMPRVELLSQLADSNARIRNVTAEVRARYIASAQLWSNADPTEMQERDLLLGPAGDGAFNARRGPGGAVIFPEITCMFVEPARRKALSGKTPKFECGPCPDGCTVEKAMRVKYASELDPNGEVYAEVMATRLLWALGFRADRVYPVRVRCKNCPEQPWDIYKRFQPGKGRRADRVFTDAVVEWKSDGPKIENSLWPPTAGSQGVGFNEADRIRKEMPGLGAPDAQWDAFRLLTAFMQNSDTKPSNQRLACEPKGVTEAGTCTAPMILAQDVGATFGGGAGIFGSITEGSKATLRKWTAAPVWRHHDGCQADLSSRFTLRHPTVSEGGRAFLVRLLQSLTDAQLRDLFTASRVVARGETVRDATGAKRAASVDDWVKAFHTKVEQLADPCGTR